MNSGIPEMNNPSSPTNITYYGNVVKINPKHTCSQVRNIYIIFYITKIEINTDKKK